MSRVRKKQKLEPAPRGRSGVLQRAEQSGRDNYANTWQYSSPPCFADNLSNAYSPAPNRTAHTNGARKGSLTARDVEKTLRRTVSALNETDLRDCPRLGDVEYHLQKVHQLITGRRTAPERTDVRVVSELLSETIAEHIAEFQPEEAECQEIYVHTAKPQKPLHDHFITLPDVRRGWTNGRNKHFEHPTDPTETIVQFTLLQFCDVSARQVSQLHVCGSS